MMMLLAFVGQYELGQLAICATMVAVVFDRLSRPASLAEIEDPKNKKERFQNVLETAKALSKPLMPQTELEQSELKIRLANAGFRSDSAVAVYLGLRFGTLMLFALSSFAL